VDARAVGVEGETAGGHIEGRETAHDRTGGKETAYDRVEGKESADDRIEGKETAHGHKTRAQVVAPQVL
jgi:hypothetical protein